MVVGVGIIIFRIHECHSLKGKRKIVKSIIARLGNAFNISIAEVGANDVHQRAEIGFSITGNDRRLINSIMDKIIDKTEAMGLAEIIDTDMEILNF